MAEIGARRPRGEKLNQAAPGARQMRNEVIVSRAPDWVSSTVSRYDPDVLPEPGRRLSVELTAPDLETSGRERPAA
jgi:hypothetical protein